MPARIQFIFTNNARLFSEARCQAVPFAGGCGGFSSWAVLVVMAVVADIDRPALLRPFAEIYRPGALRPFAEIYRPGALRPFAKIHRPDLLRPLARIDRPGALRPLAKIYRPDLLRPLTKIYRPSSLRPACSSGRRPSGQWNLRSEGFIGKSLIQA